MLMSLDLKVENSSNTAELFGPKPMVEDRGVAVFENAYSPTYCKNILDLYKKMETAGVVTTRREQEDPGLSEILKNDTSWCPHQTYSDGDLRLDEYMEIRLVLDVFWQDVYPQYRAKYGALNKISTHTTRDIKVQKTLPGQGYHMWHCEHDKAYQNRLMAWIVYLDDHAQGGETEFLYLHKRVVPKAGTLVLFPSSFIYTHRGNPPLEHEKHIMTGWVEYE